MKDANMKKMPAFMMKKGDDAKGKGKMPKFAKGMSELHTEDLPDLKLHQVALENFPANIDLSVMEALLPMVLDTEPAEA